MLPPIPAVILGTLCGVVVTQDFVYDIGSTGVLDTLQLGSRSIEAVAEFNYSDPAVIDQALSDWQATAKHAAKPYTICPAGCSEAGTDPSRWSLFSDTSSLDRCNETLLLDFTIFTDATDPDSTNAIHACTADLSTPARSSKRAEPASCIPAKEATTSASVRLVSTGSSQSSTAVSQALVGASRQVSNYLSQLELPCEKDAISFGSAGSSVIGVYGGSQAHRQGKAIQLLEKIASYLETTGVAETLVVELCDPEVNLGSDYIVGIAVSGEKDGLSFVQDAVRKWSNGSCITSSSSGAWTQVSLQVPVRIDDSPFSNQTSSSNSTIKASIQSTEKRADSCRYIRVVSGDGCDTLASKCGIPGADITKYNTAANFCSTLMPGQPACCSAGGLPDLTPKPNADGSCNTYTTVNGDTCSSIAALNTITTAKLEEYNKNTWGWNGCDLLWVGVNMCLSSGTPPMPAPVAVRRSIL